MGEHRRLIPRPDLHAVKGIPLSIRQIKRMVAEGSFPKPIYLTKRICAWEEEVVDQWIAERKAASEPNQ